MTGRTHDLDETVSHREIAARRASRRVIALVIGLLAVPALVGGCGSSGASPATEPSVSPAPGAPPPNSGDPLDALCSDYSTWREAQDALDLDADLTDGLDDDGDGVACNELGQQEYEDAFTTATTDACEGVFEDSPDGFLFWEGARFSVDDCTVSAPLADDWEADSTGDPETDGTHNGWTQTCEEFFSSVGNDTLYWGDTVATSQTDCELAAP